MKARDTLPSAPRPCKGSASRAGAAGQGPDLEFAYGAGGQRISKQVGGTVGDPGTYREHYIRDAQGNVMATYRLHPNGAFRVQERPIYGSSRVGLYAGKVDLYPATQLVPMPQVIPVFDALLRYELTDHLGNVGTVVTGRLLPGDGAPHEAEVISAQGYEPGGSLLPGRNYNTTTYRFVQQVGRKRTTRSMVAQARATQRNTGNTIHELPAGGTWILWTSHGCHRTTPSATSSSPTSIRMARMIPSTRPRVVNSSLRPTTVVMQPLSLLMSIWMHSELSLVKLLWTRIPRRTTRIGSNDLVNPHLNAMQDMD